MAHSQGAFWLHVEGRATGYAVLDEEMKEKCCGDCDVLCPRTVEKEETDRIERSGLGWEEGRQVPDVNLRTLSTDKWRLCLHFSGVWNPDLWRCTVCQALGGLQ